MGILRLEIEGSGKVWKRDQKIRLRHVDTGGYLHSHNKKYNRLGGGQQEVRYLFVCKNFLHSQKMPTRFDTHLHVLSIEKALDHSTLFPYDFILLPCYK